MEGASLCLSEKGERQRETETESQLSDLKVTLHWVLGDKSVLLLLHVASGIAKESL